MSLRDQLLKSGLVNKKQSDRAANSIRKEQLHRTKGAHDLPKPGPGHIEQAERRTRDQELNRIREAERFRHEALNQAKEIIATNDLCDRYAEGQFYFLAGGIAIKSLPVTEQQRTDLSNGKLGICLADPDNSEEHFRLLTAEQCLRVRTIAPSLVIVLFTADGDALA